MSVLWYSYWILVRLLVLWILDSGTVIGSGTFIDFGVFWDLGTFITLVRLFDTLEYALGTYKTSGTYNLFDPFLAFGTINKYF